MNSVDSHGQARGTKIYTLRVDKKRIHPRLKTWSSAWLASSGTRGGLHGCWKLHSEWNEHEGKALTALLVEGATQAPVIDYSTNKPD